MFGENARPQNILRLSATNAKSHPVILEVQQRLQGNHEKIVSETAGGKILGFIAILNSRKIHTKHSVTKTTELRILTHFNT